MLINAIVQIITSLLLLLFNAHMNAQNKKNKILFGMDWSMEGKKKGHGETMKKKERKRGKRKTNIKQSRENNDNFFSFLIYILYIICINTSTIS